MDIEFVRQQEAANNGQTVHLFYDETVGMYLAFGLSAYYSTMVATPFVSFSDLLQLPVALLEKDHVKMLRQSMVKEEHRPQAYYRFRLRSKVGTAGYERWCKETLGDKG